MEEQKVSIAIPSDILNVQTIHKIYNYFKEHFALEPKIVNGDCVDLITILKEHNAQLAKLAVIPKYNIGDIVPTCQEKITGTVDEIRVHYLLRYSDGSSDVQPEYIIDSVTGR